MQDNPAVGQTAGLDEAVSKGSRSPVTSSPVLERISSPADVRALPVAALASLAEEVRLDLIDSVSQTGGHFGAGLGVVELTVALDHVFDDRVSRTAHDERVPLRIKLGEGLGTTAGDALLHLFGDFLEPCLVFRTGSLGEISGAYAFQRRSSPV